VTPLVAAQSETNLSDATECSSGFCNITSFVPWLNMLCGVNLLVKFFWPVYFSTMCCHFMVNEDVYNCAVSTVIVIIIIVIIIINICDDNTS